MAIGEGAEDGRPANAPAGLAKGVGDGAEPAPVRPVIGDGARVGMGDIAPGLAIGIGDAIGIGTAVGRAIGVGAAIGIGRAIGVGAATGCGAATGRG